MDPHDVLNLPHDGYTAEQLRYNYKVLARQLHPDKRRMSTEQATQLFQVLTEAYKTLLERLEGRRADRGFHEMRDDHNRYKERVQGGEEDAAERRAEEKKDFNVERFNAVFAENRLDDPVVDGGYGRWMEQNDPDDPATRRRAMAVITRSRRDEPEPTAITSRACVAFSELGASGAPADYSRADAPGGRHAIMYSDYRLAHTTEKLAEDAEFEKIAKRADRELKSVDALQKHRAKISYTMTDADRRAVERRDRDTESSERKRLDALEAYDRMVETVHGRTSRLLR